ncbi:uncharacterized protein BJ171DRAFT_490624 [Polychytrium aggregatum]|uniref:uncharacterized protein n=1 Tax=Polychytrium aggregatum TaxID=110093 RepID=UPI0022FDFA64|nr:uncharacterized protein BJ171DRAFT_490624 [Polychytrium aggregatum]KAI9208201.1 hypothetical protein BJ171DRAFT_490624 [Polychytrium aggregatum]
MFFLSLTLSFASAYLPHSLNFLPPPPPVTIFSPSRRMSTVVTLISVVFASIAVCFSPCTPLIPPSLCPCRLYSMIPLTLLFFFFSRLTRAAHASPPFPLLLIYSNPKKYSSSALLFSFFFFFFFFTGICDVSIASQTKPI